MIPPNRIKQTLTGRSRGRITWVGRVVMQVEYRNEIFPGYPGSTDLINSYTGWRDATRDDCTFSHNFIS